MFLRAIDLFSQIVIYKRKITLYFHFTLKLNRVLPQKDDGRSVFTSFLGLYEFRLRVSTSYTSYTSTSYTSKTFRRDALLRQIVDGKHMSEGPAMVYLVTDEIESLYETCSIKLGFFFLFFFSCVLKLDGDFFLQ